MIRATMIDIHKFHHQTCLGHFWPMPRYPDRCKGYIWYKQQSIVIWVDSHFHRTWPTGQPRNLSWLRLGKPSISWPVKSDVGLQILSMDQMGGRILWCNPIPRILNTPYMGPQNKYLAPILNQGSRLGAYLIREEGIGRSEPNMKSSLW